MLRDAVLGDRELRVRYRRRDGRRTEETVRPYGLVAKAESWYLVAETARGMRVFRASRVEAASLGRVSFARRADFDLQRFWAEWSRRFEGGRTGYPVTLRVARRDEEDVAESRGAAARRALGRARASRGGAKTVVVDFEREAFAVSALAGLAGAVEVRGPASLRARLADLGRRLQRAYADTA